MRRCKDSCAGEALLAYVISLFNMYVQALTDFDTLERQGIRTIANVCA
jgi:hypothetical protein